MERGGRRYDLVGQDAAGEAVAIRRAERDAREEAYERRAERRLRERYEDDGRIELADAEVIDEGLLDGR
ncbi:MAG: hypothetical protein R3B59_01120 [Dehalococcoidia bacterium]